MSSLDREHDSSSEIAASFFDALAERVADLVIERLARQTEPAPAASPWLDAAGAAEYAAMSPNAIRCATKRGQLKVHRSETGRLRWCRDDLDDFLRAEDDLAA